VLAVLLLGGGCSSQNGALPQSDAGNGSAAIGGSVGGSAGVGVGGSASGGVTGMGGATGMGGVTGAGGNLGSGGAVGAGGAVGGPLDCAGGVDPMDALVTDFSPATWRSTTGRWSTVAGDLTGTKTSGASPQPNPGGAVSSLTNSVDTTAINPSLELSGMIQPGNYGFGVLNFDRCVNTAKYTGIQFTLSGTTAGCDLVFLLQTFEQQSVANRGGCGATTLCFRFPQKKISIGAQPAVIRFTDLENSGLPAGAAAMKAEIVGLQWQFQSPTPVDGGAQPACFGIDLKIDDIQFVSN
jgi:hypothetical protein